MERGFERPSHKYQSNISREGATVFGNTVGRDKLALIFLSFLGKGFPDLSTAGTIRDISKMLGVINRRLVTHCLSNYIIRD